MNVTTALVNVGGTWEAGYATGVRTTSGVVTGGQETADRWLIYLDPLGLPPCFDYPFPFSTHGQGFQLSLTRTGNRLTGTSLYRTCTESFQGTIDITR